MDSLAFILWSVVPRRPDSIHSQRKNWEKEHEEGGGGGTLIRSLDQSPSI